MTVPANKKIVADIALGRHDEHLMDFVDAVRERIMANEVQTRWKIVHEDCEFTEDSITIGELRAVEKLTDTNWIELNPRSSAEHMIAFLATHLMTHHGMDTSTAYAQAEGYSVNTITQMISEYVVAPKDDAATEKTTS